MRIDKFITSQRTDISRSQVKKIIRAGRVTLDGEKVTAPDVQVTEKNIICVDGERIHYKEHIYIMLNKPQGYVCSAREGSSPTVYELIPDEYRRRGLFPAGRLDKDTEGFVLMTDDGALAHEMLSPTKHVPKTYFVKLARPCEPNYAQMFADGLVIDGGEKCKPAQFHADESDACACELILHEGKFHQVKRMFASLGNEVVYLRRTKIGNLEIDQNLPLGKCLEIMNKNVDKLLYH